MDRFNSTETGYRYDRILFLCVFLIFLLLVLNIMYVNNFDFSTKPYFKCNYESCRNPYYEMQNCNQQLNILWMIPLYTTEDCHKTCEWCNQEYLSNGVYGELPKASFLYNNILLISIGLLAIGLLLNHFIHNRGKKFDIEIQVSKKIVINRRTLGEFFEQGKNNFD